MQTDRPFIRPLQRRVSWLTHKSPHYILTHPSCPINSIHIVSTDRFMDGSDEPIALHPPASTDRWMNFSEKVDRSPLRV